MDFFALTSKFIVALIIGAVIGLERESQGIIKAKDKESQHKVGVRTLSLLGALGALSGILFVKFLPIFILISCAVVAILLTYYVLHSFRTRDVGFTTELGILYSYIIGVVIGLEVFPMQVTLALSVIVIMILSRKSDIQLLLRGIQREELLAFISYGLIALVVLPFLPNKGFTLSSIPTIDTIVSSFGGNIDSFKNIEILNPFKLWFIIVLITGIDIVGYALERIIGARPGRLIASIVGGFISSTATTLALAQESKTIKKNVGYLVAAAVFANTASFFQLFILIGVTNGDFLVKATPTLMAVIITGLASGLYFMREKVGHDKVIMKNIKGIKESEIFALGPALKFGFLFFLVTIATRIALVLFGQTGFLVASSIAALTGVDAVTINIATLAGTTMNFQTAVFALILMNAVNLVAKCFYSFMQGKREFAVKFSISVSLIIASSLLGLLLV